MIEVRTECVPHLFFLNYPNYQAAMMENRKNICTFADVWKRMLH